MREILFKAKRVDDREWVVGQYVNTCYPGKDKETGHFIVVHPNKYHEVYTSTLCQFTGLCDKNGNKIWENDIFQYTDETMVTQKDLIEYNETHASFVRLHNTEKLGLQYLWIDEATCNHGEVIGNIFDNKELLQEGYK